MVTKPLISFFVQCFLFYCYVGTFESVTAQDVLVNTAQGTVRGIKDSVTAYLLIKERVISRPFYKFLGIPYAQPPVGPLRFKPPRPPLSWTGVRDAKVAGDVCVQGSAVIKGSEDCLYINVYTPKLPQEREHLKAVMFWIYGGSFQTGDGIQIYGPDYLVSKDVVVVTFNYRLNVLGFLSLENNQASGNYGLKDQVQALKWVQQNIANFGGDPTKVTIFGESAGGASVHYHLLSPLPRGLFHRAIIQSGPALSDWAFTKTPKANAFKLAQFLGQNITDENELYDFFMTQPASTLAKAASVLRNQQFTNVRQTYNTTIFLPSIEVESNESPFITQSPTDIMLKGNFTKVPLMFGTLNAEGIVIFQGLKLTEEKFQIFNTYSDWAVPPTWEIQSEAERSQIGEVVKSFFFKGKPVSWGTVDDLVSFYTDAYYILDAEKSIAGFLNYSSAPIYQYEMTFVPSRSPIKLLANLNQSRQNAFNGAAHGDDVPLLFRPYGLEAIPFPYTDQVVSQKMTRMWTNFAKTGNPNYLRLGVTWKKLQKNSRSYLDIDSILYIKSGKIQQKRNPNYLHLGVTWKKLQKNSRSYLDIGSKFCIKNGKVQQERLKFWKDLCKTTSTEYNCELL